MKFLQEEELYDKLLSHKIKEDDEILKYADHAYLQPEIQCFSCFKKMSKTIKKNKVTYKWNQGCKEFSNFLILHLIKTRLTLYKQFQLITYFVQELNLKQLKNFTGIAKTTILKFFKGIRKLIYSKVNETYLHKIGGPSHAVQIDMPTSRSGNITVEE